eukprot:UN08585
MTSRVEGGLPYPVSEDWIYTDLNDLTIGTYTDVRVVCGSFPTISPSKFPTGSPSTSVPTYLPTTNIPTNEPSDRPTRAPSTSIPTMEP